MLASHALALVGVPMRRVIRVVQEQRDARYKLLRGYFHGLDDDDVNELDHERLRSLTLPLVGKFLGRPLGDLDLFALGVQAVSLRLKNGQTVVPDASTVLGAGDTLVLSGKPEGLALAEKKLLGGGKR
jgi:CPA2 family monovalent cation:H+ antiporter-2